MPELNWFCKKCKRINISCDGSTNQVYSNCVHRKNWLDRGEKVRIIRGNKIGIIQEWNWVTNSYFVKFDDRKVFPYRRDELGEVLV